MYIRLINRLFVFVIATMIPGATFAQVWKDCCPESKTVARLVADGTFTVSGHGNMCFEHDAFSNDAYPEDKRLWRDHLEAIVKVIIEDGVTHISTGAFVDCPNLTSVTIAGSVEEIYPQAFAGNPKLTSLTISEGVKKLHNAVFESCNSLKSVTIPKSENKKTCNHIIITLTMLR